MDAIDEIVSATLNTTASEGGNQLNYGDYVVFIDRVKAQKGNEGSVFCPELFVDQATDVAIDGVMQKATVPGSIASYPCKMNKKPAASNARGFVLSCLDKPEAGKDDPALQGEIASAMRRMVQHDQPLRGLAFRVTTYKYENKGRDNAANKGKSFPRYKFTRIPNQTKETIAANRAKMDAVAAGRAQAQAAAVVAQPAAAPAPAPAAVAAPPAPPAPASIPAAVQTYAQPAPVAAPAPAVDPFAGMFG